MNENSKQDMKSCNSNCDNKKTLTDNFVDSFKNFQPKFSPNYQNNLQIELNNVSKRSEKCEHFRQFSSFRNISEFKVGGKSQNSSLITTTVDDSFELSENSRKIASSANCIRLSNKVNILSDKPISSNFQKSFRISFLIKKGKSRRASKRIGSCPQSILDSFTGASLFPCNSDENQSKPNLLSGKPILGHPSESGSLSTSFQESGFNKFVNPSSSDWGDPSLVDSTGASLRHSSSPQLEKVQPVFAGQRGDQAIKPSKEFDPFHSWLRCISSFFCSRTFNMALSFPFASFSFLRSPFPLLLLLCTNMLCINALGCRLSEYTCGNYECVPADAYCDGIPDCADRTDEPRECSRKYLSVCTRLKQKVWEENMHHF